MTKQRKIIVANWKMNFGVKESVVFISKLKRLLTKKEITKQIIICPSFTSLFRVNQLIGKSSILLGAQNIAEVEQGTFTGEVSAKMIKEVGCQYVIVGHSERRQKLNETDNQINAKISQIYKNNLIPILCVGERELEYRKNLTAKIIDNQLNKDLKNIKINKKQKLLIAYEPIWAISDGKSAKSQPTIEEIEQTHKLIFKNLTKKYSSAIVESSCRVLYGGSVDVVNIKQILQSSLVDGVLVGGASLKVEKLVQMSTLV